MRAKTRRVTLSVVPAAAEKSPNALDDLVRRSEAGEDVELVQGEITARVAPSPAHGSAQMGLGEVLAPMRRRGGGGGGPGGWWLMTEVEVLYANGDVYRHDAVGFRRDLHSERPAGFPIRERPDWVAEILSPGTARRDLGAKLRTLFADGVPHYWIVDPEHELLTVYQHQTQGYLVLLAAGISDVVRAEPFDAIEVSVAALFGKDD